MVQSSEARAKAIHIAKAKITAERRRIDDHCKADGLWWARNQTCTYDEHASDTNTNPYKPFPDLEYMDLLWIALLNSKRLFIPKSREMMTSWLVAAYLTWKCQWNPRALCLVQTQNEKKVQKLLSYTKCLYDQQPLWLRQMHSLKGGALTSADIKQSKMEAVWDSEASLIGVPGGEHQIRLYHPSVVVFDEAAHLIEARQAYDTAAPVAGQIICISSAGPGFFAEMCDDDFIDGGVEGELRERFLCGVSN